MKRIRVFLVAGALVAGCAFGATEVAVVRHVTLEHVLPSEVAKSLAAQMATMRSSAEVYANDATHQIVLKGPAPIASALEEHARAMDAKGTLPKGAVLMEFAVTEREADGSKHIVAAPRIISQPGQDASVRVDSEDRGLDLKIQQKKLADGRIQLGVACDSWHRVQDASGKGSIKSRKVRSKVIVAEGKKVKLESTGDHRMTLELEVHAM